MQEMTLQEGIEALQDLAAIHGGGIRLMMDLGTPSFTYYGAQDDGQECVLIGEVR